MAAYHGHTITREDIVLSHTHTSQLAFLLHNVLTKKECQAYIDKTEAMGYEAALINTGGSTQKLMTDVRNSSRCIWDTEEEAKKLWDRIKEFVPAEFHNHRVVGLNERLRFLRYGSGEYFRPHYDGCYRRENGEKSFITVMLYLNEGCEGGCTTFLPDFGKTVKKVEVVPETGLVLVFEHEILHEGSELTAGTKYCMRTDVMYTKK